MAARSIGSGNISFGLVSIPFKLYTAASAKSVSFNMLHAKCGGRMKQQYFCPTDNEHVERAEMVRGYEFAKDRYVVLQEDELKKLESPRTGELELVEFVPAETVDLTHFEKTYYLGPDKGGERAYRLLSESLAAADRFAVGRYFIRGREQLVVVRAFKGGLCLHELFYADEVRSFDDVEHAGAFQFKPIELELANKLIEQLSVDAFDATKFSDSYRDRVEAAVQSKIEGQEVTTAPEAPRAQIVDLLEALKRSLKEGSSGNAQKDVPAANESAPALPKATAKGPKKARAQKSEEKSEKKAG